MLEGAGAVFAEDGALADDFLLLGAGTGVDLGCGVATDLLMGVLGWGEAEPWCCLAGVPDVFCLCSVRLCTKGQETEIWVE